MRAERIAALASVRAETAPVSEAELREHDAIARRVHDSGASLPARFGNVFADEPALLRALVEREDALDAELAEVGGRVELGVTISWRDRETRESAMATTGRAYLRAAATREAERRAAELVVARLVGGLPDGRTAARHRICPREGVAATVAMLVARDEVESVRAVIEAFGGRSGDVHVAVYGPMPPYSFAS